LGEDWGAERGNIKKRKEFTTGEESNCSQENNSPKRRKEIVDQRKDQNLIVYCEAPPNIKPLKK